MTASMTRVLGLVLLLAAGCGAPPQPRMTPVPPPHDPLKPLPGTAVVVFIRPSLLAGDVKLTVMDQNGRFLGQSQARSHFAVPVAPGKRVFMIHDKNVAALQAELVAGKTYFVEVAVQPGSTATPEAQLLAITPRSASWNERETWLNATDRLQSDFASGQAWVEARAQDTPRKLKKGLERLAKYSKSELAERTLQPGDGV
jgi:hypothetical protein